MGNDSDSLFKVCNGLKLFVLIVLITEISASLEEDNMLTINVAAEPVPDLQNWNTYSPDDVRCYCNLPVCIVTGYMCKSEGGGCFSEVVSPDQPFKSSSDVYKARHGCLELLRNNDQKAECRNMPSGKASSRSHPRSLLLCCFKDMCNHKDNPETQTMLNGTHIGSNEGPSQSLNGQYEPNMSASPGYNSNEVWFKAAIIAVPICGTVILVVLIVLAVKILRTDSLNTSSKLDGPYSPAIDRKSNRDHFDHAHHPASVNMKKVPLLMHHHHHHDHITGACTNHSADEIMKHNAVPLLVQNETGITHSYDKKNEANAKLNTGHGHEYNLVMNKERENPSPLLGLQKPTNITTSSNNIYRNVNLSLTSVPMSMQQQQTDKLYEKQALSAVVSWGVPSPSSSPV